MKHVESTFIFLDISDNLYFNALPTSEIVYNKNQVPFLFIYLLLYLFICYHYSYSHYYHQVVYKLRKIAP